MTKLPKYLANRVGAYEWPMLLVEHDKHSTEYTILPDLPALWRASLDILRARVKNRYIAAPGKEPGEVEEIDDDLIERLPAGLRTQAVNAQATSARRRAEHADALDLWEKAQQAIREDDGALAYLVLNMRIDHEYDRISIIKPRTP